MSSFGTARNLQLTPIDRPKSHNFGYRSPQRAYGPLSTSGAKELKLSHHNPEAILFIIYRKHANSYQVP